MSYKDKILYGDALEQLKTVPDGTAQMCVTSPPYWGLRDYGVEGQLGLEETPEEYVENMVEVFREVRRVLKDDGTLWLNLGDSYAGSGKGGNPDNSKWSGFVGNSDRENSAKESSKPYTDGVLKPKDLVGIPWRVAFALQRDGANWKEVQILERVMSELLSEYEDEPIPDKVLQVLERLQNEWADAKGDSWYLRSDIIWHKPNPMPESVKDRPTKAHEYIFLLSKSQKYYYDWEAIADPYKSDDSDLERARIKGRGEQGYSNARGGDRDNSGGFPTNGFKGKNKRSVWTVNTKPYPEAHFAVYPPDLIAPCIKAGSKPYDIVLDPFFGSGTTGEVCQRLNRHYLGIELNEDYADLQRERLSQPTLEFK